MQDYHPMLKHEERISAKRLLCALSIFSKSVMVSVVMSTFQSVEIVFTDKRRRQISPPPILPDIERVTSLKILAVTFTDRLSMSEHVQATVNASASLLYALRVLRAHGMPETALQTVFRQLSWLSFSMPLMPGGDSRLHQTDRALKQFLGRAKRRGL